MIRSDVKFDGAKISEARIDPFLFGMGVGYRFGRPLATHMARAGPWRPPTASRVPTPTASCALPAYPARAD